MLNQNTLTIESSEEITVSHRSKFRRRFSAIQPLVTLHSHPHHKGYTNDETDLIEIFSELTKPAQKLFILIKRNMRFRDFISDLSQIQMTQSEKNIRSRAARELEEAGLIARLPRSGMTSLTGVAVRFRAQQYMLSPHHLCPWDDNELEITNYWNQACKPKFKYSKYKWSSK